jgi:hypothetical protein
MSPISPGIGANQCDADNDRETKRTFGRRPRTIARLKIEILE